MSVKNMNTDFTIRIAQPADVLELKDLFQDTVLNINRRDYSQDEVEDWASCGDDLSNIEEMIKTHYFIVAVNQLSLPVPQAVSDILRETPEILCKHCTFPVTKTMRHLHASSIDF